jgi:pseudouridine-5'-phosphate glycosidase
VSGLLAVASEVAEALAAGRPVVALETTVVTHGLPQPDGLEVPVAVVCAGAKAVLDLPRTLEAFLLERLRALTADRSVTTNRALLLQNARTAGALAAAL